MNKKLQGGYQLPIACYATAHSNDENTLKLQSLVCSLDGKHYLYEEHIGTPP